MSKTSAIIVRTSVVNIDESSFKNIVDILLANGWGINSDIGISFMQNGTYDFEQAPAQDLNYVISLIESSISKNKECFIKLMWNGSFGIEVTYLNSNSIMFSLVDEIVSLSDVAIPDFSFYINRISVILEVIDLKRMECIYD